MSELGRLVAEHAKAVVTADQTSEDSGDDVGRTSQAQGKGLATAMIRNSAALDAIGKGLATTMVKNSPGLEAMVRLQQQAQGKGLATAMVRNSAGLDAIGSLDRRQLVLALQRQWVSNVTIFPGQAGSAAAPVLGVYPSAGAPQIAGLPPADARVGGWVDQWHRMSLFDRSLFIIAVVTALLTMAQVAIGVAELYQRPAVPVTTREVGHSEQGSTVVPTTMGQPPGTATSLPPSAGTSSTPPAAPTTQSQRGPGKAIRSCP